MNIIIENQESPEFLGTAGGWIKNPVDAVRFPTTVAALRAGRQQAIGKFNVIGHLPDNNQFLNLHRGRGTGQSDAGNPTASVAHDDND